MSMTASSTARTVEVTDGRHFAVRRIYCVGRNYRAHAIEMGADPDREAPFFFLKPTDAIVHSGATIRYPQRTSDYQHEIELVVAIGVGGENIAVAECGKAHIRLCRRARYDKARLANVGQEIRATLGHGQGIR